MIDTVQPAKNSADRLHALIIGMTDSGDETLGTTLISSTGLADGLTAIAKIMEFKSYLEMQRYFDRCTNSVRRDVSLLTLQRENVRANALAALDDLQGVFNAVNFKHGVGQAFDRHFSNANLRSLEDISERLDSQGFIQASEQAISDALGAAQALADTASKSGELTNRATRLIKFYIDHLSSIVSNYENHGEEDFWISYRILFSAFIEIHETHFKENAVSKEYKVKLRNMAARLLIGSSLTANAITIAPVAIQFFS